MSVYLSTPGYSALALEDPPGTLNPLLNIIKMDAPTLDFNMSESIITKDTVLTSLDGTIRTHLTAQLEAEQKTLTFPFIDTTDRDLFIAFVKAAQGEYIKLTDGSTEKIFLPIDTQSIFNDDGRANGIDQDANSLKHSITMSVRIWNK
jgi:hypothetical protein